jgi:hypothetical protein
VIAGGYGPKTEEPDRGPGFPRFPDPAPVAIAAAFRGKSYNFSRPPGKRAATGKTGRQPGEQPEIPSFPPHPLSTTSFDSF